MFLFILESIGTSELILIAVVALIVFGPRKLPQMAKTIGKTMAEFRNATNEFKTTWEKEVAFAEEEEKNPVSRNIVSVNQIPTTIEGNTYARGTASNDQISSPSIQELSANEITEKFHDKGLAVQSTHRKNSPAENKVAEKRDWL